MDEEIKKQIVRLVQKLYIGIDRQHQDPVHGIAEMNRILETLTLMFPDKEQWEFSCNIMTELLNGDRECEQF